MACRSAPPTIAVVRREHGFYGVAEVQALTTLGRSTLYVRAKRDPSFPQPVKLGPRASGWPCAEVNAWLDERIARTAEPAEQHAERVAASASVAG